MELRAQFLSIFLICLTLGCARSGLQATFQSESETGVKSSPYRQGDYSDFEGDLKSDLREEESGESPRPNLNRDEGHNSSDEPNLEVENKIQKERPENHSDPDLNSNTNSDVQPKAKDTKTGNKQDPLKQVEPKQTQGFDPSALAPGTNSKDFIERGKIVPTVYYQPFIVDNEKTCSGARVAIRNSSGVELIRVCRATYANCLMQGSCVIGRGGINRSFNVTSGNRGIFVELKSGQCEFGFGVQSICLDPFYSVAADLNFFKQGDVIFIPGLVGWELPSGEKHSGFLIVRDRGGAIKGQHRFDFFSGTLHYGDPQNPFGRAKLSDRRTRLIYYQVKGETAKKFLKNRNFPRIPLINE